MLNFLSNYLIEPAMEATKKYVIAPIVGAITKIVTGVVTKNVSSTLTTAVASNMIGPTETKDPMQLTDATVSGLAGLQEKARRAIAGTVIENTTSASLKLLSAVSPVAGPAPKLLTTVVPKAYNLLFTTPRSNPTYSKNVLVGVASHAAGTLMQESVDSLLPQAAPYGGYVAYGIGNGLTKVGLERAFRR